MRLGYFWGILLLITVIAGCKTIRPAEPAAGDETIVDAYWMLLSLEGQSPQAPNNTREAYIRLQETENDLKGNTGCNTIFGKYELSGKSVRFRNIGATRMMCPDMEQETKFLQMLERVDSFEVAGEILTLFAGSEAVATFRSGNPENLEPTNR
ncbi:META domain-containing protein [Pontibacter sp. Tf4]|uniref:META domain-containing protein n=1 Tax=Pontibacter sp. Tf4 TaxID=2761620 RepID=UPI00162A7798|nr:META domain-containing protein [Pontibacter sp. Tf4]MBB6612434.1 META domain-containing protein [Pontibacter sp. Tf4]